MRRFREGGRLRSVWLEAGVTILMLEERLRGAGPDAGSGHLLAFAVEDLSAWEGRLRGAGVSVEDRTDATIYVRDPDGHRVGLSVYRLEGSTSAGRT